MYIYFLLFGIFFNLRIILKFSSSKSHTKNEMKKNYRYMGKWYSGGKAYKVHTNKVAGVYYLNNNKPKLFINLLK